jgi:hypothetical protein
MVVIICFSKFPGRELTFKSYRVTGILILGTGVINTGESGNLKSERGVFNTGERV